MDKLLPLRTPVITQIFLHRVRERKSSRRLALVNNSLCKGISRATVLWEAKTFTLKVQQQRERWCKTEVISKLHKNFLRNWHSWAGDRHPASDIAPAGHLLSLQKSSNLYGDVYSAIKGLIAAGTDISMLALHLASRSSNSGIHRLEHKLYRPAGDSHMCLSC